MNGLNDEHIRGRDFAKQEMASAFRTEMKVLDSPRIQQAIVPVRTLLPNNVPAQVRPEVIPGTDGFLEH
jgi:hypothetical protein